MSNEERQRRNLPRFSWEVSIGDMIQLALVLVVAVKLYDQVQDHQVRLEKVDKILEVHAGRLESLDEEIAVYQDRQQRAKGD